LKCENCGAISQGVICSFCGAVVSRGNSKEEQQEALEAFHALIAEKSGVDNDLLVMRLLETGYLPTDRDVLIDAAMRALASGTASPYGVIYAATEARVQAIIFRLRLFPDDSVAANAADLLEQRLHDVEKKEENRKQNEGYIEKTVGFASGMFMVAMLVVMLLGLIRLVLL